MLHGKILRPKRLSVVFADHQNIRSYSNIYIDNKQPGCMLIDKNGDQPVTGFQVHFPDFNDKGGGYSGEVNQYVPLYLFCTARRKSLIPVYELSAFRRSKLQSAARRLTRRLGVLFKHCSRTSILHSSLLHGAYACRHHHHCQAADGWICTAASDGAANCSSTCHPTLPKSNVPSQIFNYNPTLSIGGDNDTIVPNVFGYTPILTLFFPGEGSDEAQQPAASMTCLRPVVFNSKSSPTTDQGEGVRRRSS